MAYDETLATRIRTIIGQVEGVSERKMFGGLAFMVRGNMAVGIVRDDLMVRVGPEAHERALAESHVRPMDFSGRPSRGMIYVSPAGTRADEALRGWVQTGTAFAASLPPK